MALYRFALEPKAIKDLPAQFHGLKALKLSGKDKRVQDWFKATWWYEDRYTAMRAAVRRGSGQNLEDLGKPNYHPGR